MPEPRAACPHRLPLLVALLVLAALLPTASYGDPPSATDPAAPGTAPDKRRTPAVEWTDEELADLIDQLGSAEVDAREDALRILVDAGEAAVPFLTEAANRLDMEIRWRARKALQLCRWRVDSELPLVADRLDSFLEADPETKWRMLGEWAREYEDRILPFLRQVCLNDRDRQLRERVFGLLDRTGASRETLAELATHCVRQDAGASWAWRALARSYHDGGDDEAAIECLQRVLDAGDDYNARAQLAQIHAERGELEAAVAQHEAARDLAGPAARTGHVRELARLYEELGEEDRAAEAMDVLLAEDGANYATVMMVLDFWFKHGWADRAAELCDNVMDEWPNDRRLMHRVPAVVSMALHGWLARGEFVRIPDLLLWLVEYDRIQPDTRRRAMLALAWVHQRLGETDRASEVLGQAIEGAEGDADGLAVIATLAGEWGLTGLADAAVEAATGLPGQAWRLTQARRAINRRDLSQARELLHAASNALDEMPVAMRADAAMKLLPLWDRLGDDAQVDRLLERLQADATQMVASSFSLTQNLSRPETGLRVLQAAWESLPGDEPDIGLGARYARLLLTMRKPEEALAICERILSIPGLDQWRRRPILQIQSDAHLIARRFGAARDLRLAMYEMHRYDNSIVEVSQIDLLTGDVDGALERLETALQETRSAPLILAVAAMAMRHGDHERVLELGDMLPPNQRGVKYALDSLAGLSWLAQGNTDEACPLLLRHLDQLIGRPASNTNAPQATTALSLCGYAQRVHALARRFRHTGDTVTARAAMAFALECMGKPLEAARAWLAAAHHASDPPDVALATQRLEWLMTPERAGQIADRLGNEAAAIFGEGVRDGRPDRLRRDKRSELALYIHACVLAGREAVAHRLLRHLIETDQSLDLGFLARALGTGRGMHGLPMLHLMPTIESEANDAGAWLALLLLYPQTLPGAARLVHAPTGDELQARAGEAFELCRNLLVDHPDDHRLLHFRLAAASVIGRESDADVRAIAARLAAAAHEDSGEADAAARWFASHGLFDVALAVDRRRMRPDSNQDTMIRRRRALQVRMARGDRLADLVPLIEDAMIDRFANTYYVGEPDLMTMHGLLACYAARTAMATGDTTTALREWRLASIPMALDPDVQLAYARRLALAGETDAAVARLRPWRLLARAAAERLPWDTDVRDWLTRLGQIPGLDFDRDGDD